EVEQAGRVEDVDLAAAHPRGDVPAELAEDHDRAVRHVLAGVVARALDDGDRARVPHGEALTGAARTVELASRRAVEDRVAEADRVAGVVLRRPDRDPSAAHALAYVVVC